MAAELVVKPARDEQALLGAGHGAERGRQQRPQLRAALIGLATPRRNTRGMSIRRRSLDEAPAPRRPRPCRARCRAQEQQPRRPRRGGGRFQPRPQGPSRRDEIAAGRVGDDRGVVARTAVGHDHLADQAVNAPGTSAASVGTSARSEFSVGMTTLIMCAAARNRVWAGAVGIQSLDTARAASASNSCGSASRKIVLVLFMWRVILSP